MVKTIYSLLCILAFCLLAAPMYAATAHVALSAATGTASPTTPSETTLVDKASSDWDNLSAKEKRMKRKEIKKALKEAHKGGADTELLLLVILAILLPPLAMALYDGITARFWLSLILTILGYLPGVIYTLIVILSGH